MTFLTDWRRVTLVTRKQRLRYKLYSLHVVWLRNTNCNEMSQQPLRTLSFIRHMHLETYNYAINVSFRYLSIDASSFVNTTGTLYILYFIC
jgi:hypothetical protein